MYDLVRSYNSLAHGWDDTQCDDRFSTGTIAYGSIYLAGSFSGR
jgi:hypothetical protein